jgi:UDP-glucose 6-dehydrogenase
MMPVLSFQFPSFEYLYSDSDPDISMSMSMILGVENLERLSAAEDAISACQDAHAIVVITEWKVFTTYDYAKLYEIMKKPSFVFDGRNILDHSRLREIGFNVLAIGKPAGWSWKAESH